MISRNNPALQTATLVACITTVLSQSLPYNPAYLIQGQASKVYQFLPGSSTQFAVYDVTNTLSSDDDPTALTTQLPFLDDGANSFVPVATRGGITVFSGECSEGEQELDLWTYAFGPDNRTWTQMHTISEDPDLTARFLAAGFAFPGVEAQDIDDLYVFGGMCPNATANDATWATDATYSNTLLAISPEGGADYEVSLTGTRAPPIAEAGLSITPLLPTSFKSDNTAAQQNFVLLGGHTQNAFINMSQVALFSMPEQAWAFVGIEQPSDAAVEPRSGHTSVLSEDGSKIVMFGGWVGDVTNPATPQLALLDVGQGYGGNGSWTWTVPDVQEQYLGGADGLYGHGATMLPGDIMMVTGGYPISGSLNSKRKRGSTKTMFYNTTSASWSNSYTNPKTAAITKATKSGLNSHEKTGLGAGLGVGIAVILAIAAAWFFLVRRRRKERKLREQHLRNLALGMNDGLSTREVSRHGSHNVLSGYRSPSWGARQEERIEGDGQYYNTLYPEDDAPDSSERLYKVMVNVPGPNSNLKSSLRTRGPPGFGSHFYNGLAAQPGVSTIQEVEERSDRGSLKRADSAESRPLSDPFKDPLQPPASDPAAEGRKQEVQAWVDDWQEAAGSMSLSRSASKANSRTYSNLSAYHSTSSGEKTSDRTNSDLSERSNISDLTRQRAGTINRAPSQRTVGYNLFSSAAAAMGKIGGRPEHSGPERSASKRSVSHGDLARMGTRKGGNSVEQSSQPQHKLPTPRSRDELNAAGEYFTPPESPIKDYKHHARRRSNSLTSHSNSLTSQSKKALGALGQGAKRILTGTSGVNVESKVETIEQRDRSPTKESEMADMMEVAPRTISGSGTAFWTHKQGAKDWEEGTAGRSGTVRRRPERALVEVDTDEIRRNEDDWDIETAVQQRVVQVMFTVPKEKLRVVNADNLSMISRTDTNASRGSNRSARSDEGTMDMKRMSRVVEDGEDDSTIVGAAQLAMTSLHSEPPSSWKGKDAVLDRMGSGASGVSIGRAL
ncbi:hypothetical protein LTR70_010351 [Exophiala xenobiotica]|uniref:Attractin/MKLN-like beta-propeller domain-containing protein n=1 Tax=Lithohypha guttulata TaxID=1690604 RepID=A0ABR0JW09_9EURO|nr:hypothetical protein LTR24_009982 [Lithohypha guttulata]KAK5309373.1 hypothetical protein LTR70_010351 [Exophiala xenobiotica]